MYVYMYREHQYRPGDLFKAADLYPGARICVRGLQETAYCNIN